MTTQPTALEMADSLDKFCNPWDKEVASELRRLHADNERLRAALDQPEQEPVILSAL